MTPTCRKLSTALTRADLHDMAARAILGYYDDFLSPLDMPINALVADLRAAGTPVAMELARKAMAGEFDATPAEADEWAQSPAGRETIAGMRKPRT